jgi:hypothetical protein
MTLCTTRNTVSKKSFITALNQADHLLDQIGSLYDPDHKTHRYNVYDIQHLKPYLLSGRDIAAIEDWLQQHFIPDTIDWMLELEQHDALDHFVSHTQVYAHLEVDKFQLSKAFIREQLDLGFRHTFASPTETELQQLSNADSAKLIVDHLKSMLVDPLKSPPTWRITISSGVFESQMLCVLMQHGLVCVHFYRPHSPR